MPLTSRVKGTIAEIATQFSVGQTFLKKMLRQKREISSLKRLPTRAGAKKVLSEPQRLWLAQKVKQQPDATLAELQENLLQTKQVSVSASTVCRELKQLRLGRKKISNCPGKEQSETSVVLAAVENAFLRAVEVYQRVGSDNCFDTLFRTRCAR